MQLWWHMNCFFLCNMDSHLYNDFLLFPDGSVASARRWPHPFHRRATWTESAWLPARIHRTCIESRAFSPVARDAFRPIMYWRRSCVGAYLNSLTQILFFRLGGTKENGCQMNRKTAHHATWAPAGFGRLCEDRRYLLPMIFAYVFTR